MIQIESKTMIIQEDEDSSVTIETGLLILEALRAYRDTLTLSDDHDTMKTRLKVTMIDETIYDIKFP